MDRAMSDIIKARHKRIKVLYIQVPPGGGSLIALYELLNHLDKQLIEPVILCYYKNKFTIKLQSIEGCKVVYLFEKLEAPPVNGSAGKKYGSLINYLRLQVKAFKDIFFADKAEVRKVYDIIAEEKPDIIHHNNDILLNRNCVRAANKTGVPQVIHNRSLAGYGNSRVDYFFDQLYIKKVAFHVNITKAVSNHFNALFHFKDNSMVMHDVIDINRYKSGEPDNDLKNELAIKNGECVITCIGRLTKWKGQHILIEAVHRLPIENFKILIVGSDDDGIGSKRYSDELKKMVRDFSLEDKVIFAGDRDDIPEILNLSDVIVHTSIKPEPQGLVILEALLCQKKVIAVDAGGSGELVKKYGGIQLESGNVQMLADLLNNVLRNPNAYPFDEAKYEALQNDFDPKRQIQILTDIYKGITAHFLANDVRKAPNQILTNRVNAVS
jgi:glycosyltransferase involved in cell wall biosynthesis